MTKSENIHFYELSCGKDNSIQLNHAVIFEKNYLGQVTSGIYKGRNGNNWEVCEADSNKHPGVRADKEMVLVKAADH